MQSFAKSQSFAALREIVCVIPGLTRNLIMPKIDSGSEAGMTKNIRALVATILCDLREKLCALCG